MFHTIKLYVKLDLLINVQFNLRRKRKWQSPHVLNTSQTLSLLSLTCSKFADKYYNSFAESVMMLNTCSLFVLFAFLEWETLFY